MPIILIEGPAQSGKTTIANALRNNSIAHGRGALLVDEQTEGDLKPLVEKILAGDELQEGVDASAQKWKPECSVILVGERAAMLEQFEAAAPGFAAMHGPVFRVNTSTGS